MLWKKIKNDCFEVLYRKLVLHQMVCNAVTGNGKVASCGVHCQCTHPLMRWLHHILSPVSMKWTAEWTLHWKPRNWNIDNREDSSFLYIWKGFMMYLLQSIFCHRISWIQSPRCSDKEPVSRFYFQNSRTICSSTDCLWSYCTEFVDMVQCAPIKFPIKYQNANCK